VHESVPFGARVVGCVGVQLSAPSFGSLMLTPVSVTLPSLVAPTCVDDLAGAIVAGRRGALGQRQGGVCVAGAATLAVAGTGWPAGPVPLAVAVLFTW
jgi:hypothetical protein